MDNNPISGPAPTPAPAPEPAATPAPMPTPMTEPVPTPAPEVISTPEPVVAPEPVVVSEPTVAPEPTPVAAPTTDPAPIATTPDATIGNEPAAINPFAPEASTPNVIDPVTNTAPAQDKKGSSGKLIGIIAGIGVLVIGIIAVLALHFISTSPEKVFNSAVLNLLTQKTISFDATAEITSGEESHAYTVSLYADNGDVTYVRFSGIAELLSAIYSAFNMQIEEEATAKMKEIDAIWWKIETDGNQEGSLFYGLADTGYDNYAKIASAYKKYPFLVPEKVSGNYRTSGTAYKVSIDLDKYSSYKEELVEDDITSVPFGTFEVSDDTDSFIITISSSFFGGGVITGLYQEKASGSDSTTKTSIDFEHAIKTAPTDAKDFSEMENMLAETTEDEVTPTSQEEDDTRRRNDYSALSASITMYMTNNNGQLPNVGTLDATKYVNSDGLDPAGNAYVVRVVEYDSGLNPTTSANGTEVYVILRATCKNEKPATSESSHAFAIYGALEGEPKTYCLASS